MARRFQTREPRQALIAGAQVNVSLDYCGNIHAQLIDVPRTAT